MSGNSHRYLPTGPGDAREMLEAIGVDSVDDLFASLPASIHLDEAPDVEGPLSDQELRTHFQALERSNQIHGRDLVSFLGGGAYRHDVPAAADHLMHRTEFFSVYTPYQPEMSQGTLQAIFEFQTMISMLTGLPVSNASLYDGATAFAEGVFMADRLQRKRGKVVVSRAVHPHYRATLDSYAQNLDLEIVEVGFGEDGRTDLAELEAAVDEQTICIGIQSPNYLGVVEPWEPAAEIAHAKGALLIGVVTEALSLALLQTPGDGGCDIAVGEAQSFGLSLAYGGPYLGFLATIDKAKRAMPGRLVGQTVDGNDRRAWVLTLATREQHIRREKATSNICTNQALCALAATFYMALHGRVGLRRLAEINLQRAAYLRSQLEGAHGLSSRFASPCFNEFAVQSREPVGSLLAELQERGILGGVPLGPDYPELEDSFLVAVTETNPPNDLDRFATELGLLAVSAESAAKDAPADTAGGDDE